MVLMMMMVGDSDGDDGGDGEKHNVYHTPRQYTNI